MGDRGNIVMVEESGNQIYLYSHWAGTELPEILQKALVRGKNRWDDESYLARIIFSEMIQKDILSETGYGISTYRCDENHPDLEVRIKDKRVVCNGQEWSFEEFTQLTDPINQITNY